MAISSVASKNLPLMPPKPKPFKILDTYPSMSDYIDDFLPKKDAFRVVKCHDHIELG